MFSNHFSVGIIAINFFSHCLSKFLFIFCNIIVFISFYLFDILQIPANFTLYAYFRFTNFQNNILFVDDFKLNSKMHILSRQLSISKVVHRSYFITHISTSTGQSIVASGSSSSVLQAVMYYVCHNPNMSKSFFKIQALASFISGLDNQDPEVIVFFSQDWPKPYGFKFNSNLASPLIYPVRIACLCGFWPC